MIGPCTHILDCGGEMRHEWAALSQVVSLDVLRPYAERRTAFLQSRSPTDSCSMTRSRLHFLLLLLLLHPALRLCCCEQVFGAAACLSTHWVPGGGVPVAWLAQGNIPDPATHRWAYLPDDGYQAGASCPDKHFIAHFAFPASVVVASPPTYSSHTNMQAVWPPRMHAGCLQDQVDLLGGGSALLCSIQIYVPCMHMHCKQCLARAWPCFAFAMCVQTEAQ
jgi:hypothetical protein